MLFTKTDARDEQAITLTSVGRDVGLIRSASDDRTGARGKPLHEHGTGVKAIRMQRIDPGRYFAS